MGNTLLNVFKFFLAVILMPIVYATVISFQTHLVSYPKGLIQSFSGGIITCLFIFLFLYQFWVVYEAEHVLTSGVFKFLAPLNKWIAYVVPTFYILTMGLLYAIYRVGDVDGLEHQMFFIAGLLLSMHILVLSQDLQNPEKGLTKPTYLLVLALTVIVSLFSAVLMMDVVTERKTIHRFSKQWLGNTRVSYTTIAESVVFWK